MRTMTPKKLRVGRAIDFEAHYDPSATTELARLLDEDQDITVRFGTPFFLFSKQGMAWLVGEEVKFRGHLSSFEPVEAEDGSATMSIGVTLSEDASR